jgi:hypothetical protein
LLSYQHFKFERKIKRVGNRIDLLQKNIFEKILAKNTVHGLFVSKGSSDYVIFTGLLIETFFWRNKCLMRGGIDK